MHSSNRVIKSKNVKVVDGPSTEKARFVPPTSDARIFPRGLPASFPRRGDPHRVGKKIESAVKHAYERGHAEGFRKGTEEAGERACRSGGGPEEAAPRGGNIRRSILERGEARVLKLVIAVARKVVRQEVAMDRDVILSVLREAVKNCWTATGSRSA